LRVADFNLPINPQSALLTLPVRRVLAAEAAEFGKFEPLGRFLLVLGRAVIPPLALSAGERDDVSHGSNPVRLTVTR
jgi:hypothetical protein